MPANGTYTETFTNASDGGVNCQNLPTQMVTYPPSNDGGTDGGLPSGCTCSGATLTCSNSQTSMGYTTTDSLNITYTATGWSGTVTAETTGPDGGILYGPCTYDVNAHM